MKKNEEITIQEYQEIKNKRIEELEDYIYEICDIIDMQCPLKYQDAWLKAMRQKKLYDSEDGEFIPDKPCCRNGCEKCEQ